MAVLTYEVTQAHINAGCQLNQHSGDNCPHYHAAIGAILGLGWGAARFGDSRLILYRSTTRINFYSDARIEYPDDVYDWIHDYDHTSQDAWPGTFSFDIPTPEEVA